MIKLSPKLQNELILAGHMVSVKGRFFISLEALRHVDGTPIAPEPDEPPAPPPSKRDLLVAEREAQHAQQTAELEEVARGKVEQPVQAEQAASAADSGATDGGADGDRSQDRNRRKG